MEEDEERSKIVHYDSWKQPQSKQTIIAVTAVSILFYSIFATPRPSLFASLRRNRLGSGRGRGYLWNKMIKKEPAVQLPDISHLECRAVRPVDLLAVYFSIVSADSRIIAHFVGNFWLLSMFAAFLRRNRFGSGRGYLGEWFAPNSRNLSRVVVTLAAAAAE